MNFIETKLGDLVAEFGGRLASFNAKNALTDQTAYANSLLLKGIQALGKAESCHLAFLTNPKFRDQLLLTKAGVVLIRETQYGEVCEYLENNSSEAVETIAWLVNDPYLYYAKIQQWWVAKSEFKPAPGIHPRAVVDPTAEIALTASVSANCVIGAHAKIGAGSRIEAGVVLGNHVEVGSDSRIYPNVTVYDECLIGSNCIIHSGVVIGADGFGFANEKGTWIKIPQVGKVVIADHVEIGANTTIDRGALDDTLIGFGVKLDNQIQIAHNVTVGEHSAMAGCVGVAGSTSIGARCTVGGAAMVFGHLNITDGTHVSGASVVMSSIKEPGAYTGIFPLQGHKDWEKTAVTLKQLLKLRGEVRELRNKLKKQ
ncbi:UDP-3-O-(3-hydroxymyristoyl)glucosamine N-acyltransferase [Limnobacter parvus]|uniref:UDP-3-O-acylglucosamine N-acyltransferase n=1 Tax=Limnobacter parvus TaxID=2939690 RepID=A0ABT1XJA6_9BURK|nr:UDP-3-O-(3-hydroxymyristoyl)glucosamine N-acyltransferase [Limnobacter parvus]MCR2746971.1 UDP-3-O-(3-hydroxymyristoyl)glucosamine N-acyltransferase [Limnobacter parvus]